MDELFFGEKRKKTRRSPRRSPRRVRRSPRRSPKRKRVMCNKKLSLSKLRKLAVEHGVNIFSEAKTAINKRTGMPKKSKMVGCTTLMKRLNEVGLGHLFKLREVHVKPNSSPDEQLFMEEDMNDLQVPQDEKLLHPSLISQADPACHSAFQKLAEKQPNNRAMAKFLKEYKGYAMGQGPCEKRQLVPMRMHGSEDDLDDYAEVAGFEMNYGRRYMSGARPKKSQKHAGVIEVKGRTHHVFKGREGGLYYLKSKTGRKIYIDKERLKKKSKK